MPTIDEIRDWKGREIHGQDDKLGKVDEIYLDQETGEPEWALVKTGLFGTQSSFVPIRDAQLQGEDIHVPFDKEKVKEAPRVEADGELSPEEEEKLYRHYGYQPTGEAERRDPRDDADHGHDHDRDATAPPVAPPAGQPRQETDRETVGHDTSHPTTDDAMTRSEEELRVGTQRSEAGRARLRKYVETEHVQQTVPVQREQVRIEREPITDADAQASATDGPAISDEEHEVVLHEEEVVVEKRAVPKERIRMTKETVTDEVVVEDEVRKERVEEVGGDATDRPGAADRPGDGR